MSFDAVIVKNEIGCGNARRRFAVCGSKLAVEVLELFIAVLRDAVSLKSGGKILLNDFSEQSEALSQSNTLKRLLDMYDVVCGIYRSVDNNPNYTLLSAVLCARL